MRLEIPKYLKPAFRFFDDTVLDLFRHEGLMYAGSISFFGILSFAPLMVVFASIVGFILYFIGEGQQGDITATLNELAEYGREVVPYMTESLKVDLMVLVNHRTTLGVAGLLTLIISSSQLFRAFEFALGRIFHSVPHSVKKKKPKGIRNIFASKLLFGGFVILIAFSFLMIQMLINLFFDILTRFWPDGAQAILGLTAEGKTLPNVLFSIVATVVFFVLITKMCARRPINFWFAALGGLIYHYAIVAMGLLYNLYVKNFFQHIDNAYGSMSAVYILVLWIFCLALVFLLCAEIVKALQMRFPAKIVGE